MTDAELVRATLAGSRDAYAEIARRWAARVTAVCHARVRRADVADDLAQETLLRGYRALHTLSDPAKVGTWLMGIGHAGGARLAEGQGALDAAVQRARPGPADRGADQPRRRRRGRRRRRTPAADGRGRSPARSRCGRR